MAWEVAQATVLVTAVTALTATARCRIPGSPVHLVEVLAPGTAAPVTPVDATLALAAVLHGPQARALVTVVATQAPAAVLQGPRAQAQDLAMVPMSWALAPQPPATVATVDGLAPALGQEPSRSDRARVIMRRQPCGRRTPTGYTGKPHLVQEVDIRLCSYFLLVTVFGLLLISSRRMPGQ